MIDVVIAARNEAAMLGACLQAIQRDAAGGDVQVIVVDNGSTDATADIAAAHDARVLREPAPNVSAARNRAIASGTGDLIALLDAHCVIERGWLRAMRSRFDDPSVAMCQGRLEHRALDPRLDAYVRTTPRFAHAALLDDTIYGRFNLYPWALSGNTMVRRSAIEAAGGFDRTLLACEDVDLGWRVIMQGLQIVSAEDAVATHWDPSPWRRAFAKSWRYGRAAAQLARAWSAHGASKTLRPRKLLGPSFTETALRVCYAAGHWFEAIALAMRAADAPSVREPLRVSSERRVSFAWDGEARLRISPNVVFWNARDETIVVHGSQRARFVLEGASRAIWRDLAAGYARERVVRSLAGTFGIHERTAVADVDDFIDELVAAGVLERQISLGP